MTLTYKLDLKISKMCLHAENELSLQVKVYKSWSITNRHTQRDRHERTHYHIAFADGKKLLTTKRFKLSKWQHSEITNTRCAVIMPSDVRYLAWSVCDQSQSSFVDVEVSRTTSTWTIISLSCMATSGTSVSGGANHSDGKTCR